MTGECRGKSSWFRPAVAPAQWKIDFFCTARSLQQQKPDMSTSVLLKKHLLGSRAILYIDCMPLPQRPRTHRGLLAQRAGHRLPLDLAHPSVHRPNAARPLIVFCSEMNVACPFALSPMSTTGYPQGLLTLTGVIQYL